MNRTAIEWTDYTWKPVTGCWGPGGTAEKPNRCSYCYAVGVAKRFRKAPWEDQFAPEERFERLGQPELVKKPSKIFVCSMADLFGDWIPRRTIEAVLVSVKNAPWHTFQFLTKNPKRLKDFNPWPENCWVGTTVTNQADADERLLHLIDAQASVLFVSMEPLLGPIDLTRTVYPLFRQTHEHHPYVALDALRGHMIGPDDVGLPKLSWGIIGAQTGPGAVKPKPEWVQGLIDQYRAAGVPLFLKENLNWTGKVQEWPV